MEHADVAPADCPTPGYHATHYYCPSCTFTADDAPVSEVEAQRSRADALHAQLGETLAALAEAERKEQLWRAEWQQITDTAERLQAALAESRERLELAEAREHNIALDYSELRDLFTAAEQVIEAAEHRSDQYAAVLSRIAQYDSQWEGQRVNDMPNRHQLIRWAYEGLKVTGG